MELKHNCVVSMVSLVVPRSWPRWGRVRASQFAAAGTRPGRERHGWRRGGLWVFGPTSRHVLHEQELLTQIQALTVHQTDCHQVTHLLQIPRVKNESPRTFYKERTYLYYLFKTVFILLRKITHFYAELYSANKLRYYRYYFVMPIGLP